MKSNTVKLYDLEAVNTTIVLRELVPNPDTVTVCMFDLQAVNTTIALYSIPCVTIAGTSVEVFPGTGQLVMTGYAPTVSVTNNIFLYPGTGELIMTGYAPDITTGGTPDPTNRRTIPENGFKYKVVRSPYQRVKVIQRFEA